MHALMGTARVMVMVAHDLGTIVEMCNRVIWMEQGRVRAEGDAATVVGRYIEAVSGAARAA
jgi:ABC-type polysaccharide/polyol phosphate transport system ATPase subunit